MVMSFKKVAAATAMTAALLAVTTGSVFAASDASASVGDDGDSYTYSDDSDWLSVDNHQHGYLGNLDMGFGVSGFNSQSHSDDENYMQTGGAAGFGGSDNFLNSNASFLGDDSEGSAVSEAWVGEDGNASAEAYDNDSIRVDNHNHGWLENFTLGAAVSGFNRQNRNDDGNELHTGDSLAEANAWNELNSNWTWIDGGHSAYATAGVTDDGDSFAYADDSDRVRVLNRNWANLGNASVAVAVSGGNSQSRNDDDNVLETGSSIASSSVSNFVNNNVTIVNSEDHVGPSATASASTGEDGDSTSESYDNDSVRVENSNNANVENVSVSAGVSGGNSQSGNDDGSHMVTGEASGSSCSTNTVNSSWTVIGGSLPEGSQVGCH